MVAIVPVTIKYFSAMVLVRVYLNKTCEEQNQRVFEARVDWDHSIHFPVESCLETFRTLYGKNAIIRFDFY